MQVSAGQDGIQRLLAAEQEAQKIVAKARKGKVLGHVSRTKAQALKSSALLFRQIRTSEASEKGS